MPGTKAVSVSHSESNCLKRIANRNGVFRDKRTAEVREIVDPANIHLWPRKKALPDGNSHPAGDVQLKAVLCFYLSIRRPATLGRNHTKLRCIVKGQLASAHAALNLGRETTADIGKRIIDGVHVVERLTVVKASVGAPVFPERVLRANPKLVAEDDYIASHSPEKASHTWRIKSDARAKGI